MSERRQRRLGCMAAAWAVVVIGLSTGPGWAGTVHVSSVGNDGADGLTWGTSKRNVQAGLNAAATGDDVWVAAGVYVENITLKAGVALYGGFASGETDLSQRDWTANETVLDGNQAGSVVTAPAGLEPDSRIDGFTIRNGNGAVTESGRCGGGIYCSSSSPTIANNTLTGNTAGSSGGGIYCGNGSAPEIRGNIIRGNSLVAGSGGGIFCGDGSPLIVGNVIAENDAPWGSGIFSCASSSAITDNLITRNTGDGIYWTAVDTPSAATIAGNRIIGNPGRGIYCQGFVAIRNNAIAGNQFGIDCTRSSALIANNTITGNCVAGISFYQGSPTVANNIVAFNSSGIGAAGGAVLSLRCNCVYGNFTSTYVGIEDPTGSDGNIAADPKLAWPFYVNVHIQPDSPCVDSGDNSVLQADWIDMDGQARKLGNRVDIGADESDGTVWPSGGRDVVRVRPDGDDANDGSTWALAKRTVQAGIGAAAASGSQVWVAAGTYVENITLALEVAVYGGFAGDETGLSDRDFTANTTILDGNQAGSVVTATSKLTRGSRIDGFTIRNGIGIQYPAEYGGGGIFCMFSSPTIANNRITGNTAWRGGGILCFYASPLIANNTIDGNEASQGGGIYSYGASAVIVNNRIVGNDSSGSYGGGGGVCCDSDAAAITGNVIAGNSAGSGAGILFTGSSTSAPTIANNTIVGNIGNGVHWSRSSAVTISNTIIAFNHSGIVKAGGIISLRYNCVYGNTGYNYGFGIANPVGTNGNISADPLFVSAGAGQDGVWGTADDDYGDLHLREGSPCINVGDPAYVTAGEETDLDGQARVMAGCVDIGADEFTWPADANDDGYVDVADLLSLVYSFGKGPGEEGFDGRCDFNGDGEVDVVDLLMLVEDFGK